MGDDTLDIGLMPRVLALLGHVHTCVSQSKECKKAHDEFLHYEKRDAPSRSEPDNTRLGSV